MSRDEIAHNKDEIVLETKDAKVRIIEISPHTKVAWHHHSEVTDHCFCLEGIIEVHTQEPDQVISLMLGERCTIAVGKVHRVVNCTDRTAKYLLVQGVGKCDFIENE